MEKLAELTRILMLLSFRSLNIGMRDVRMGKSRRRWFRDWTGLRIWQLFSRDLQAQRISKEYPTGGSFIYIDAGYPWGRLRRCQSILWSLQVCCKRRKGGKEWITLQKTHDRVLLSYSSCQSILLYPNGTKIASRDQNGMERVREKERIFRSMKDVLSLLIHADTTHCPTIYISVCILSWPPSLNVPDMNPRTFRDVKWTSRSALKTVRVIGKDRFDSLNKENRSRRLFSLSPIHERSWIQLL